MKSKDVKDKPSEPSTQFLEDNLPSESAEEVVANGLSQIRIIARQEELERVVSDLEKQGYLKTGYAKNKGASKDTQLWRAYLVKKTQAAIEDGNIEAELAEVTAAQNELAKLKTRIANGNASLEKATKTLATYPDDAAHYPLRAMHRNMVKEIGEELKLDRAQLTHLEDTIRRGAGLLEKQRRLAQTREIITNLPRIACQNEGCQVVGGLKPADGIKQPKFECYSREDGWRDPTIRAWIDAVCERCLSRQQVPLDAQPTEPGEKPAAPRKKSLSHGADLTLLSKASTAKLP